MQSYRNHSIYLLHKSTDWFLIDENFCSLWVNKYVFRDLHYPFLQILSVFSLFRRFQRKIFVGQPWCSLFMKSSPPEISFLRVWNLNLGFLELFFVFSFYGGKKVRNGSKRPKIQTNCIASAFFSIKHPMTAIVGIQVKI